MFEDAGVVVEIVKNTTSQTKSCNQYRTEIVASNSIANNRIIENILKRVRSHLGEVLNVSVNIHVHSISQMNQEDMRYTMEMFQFIIDQIQNFSTSVPFLA